MQTSAPRADAAAASIGATDLFVLRRVRGDRFVHFGGSGRGAGWAGLIEVAAEDERSLREALSARRPVRVAHGSKELVFGPYYARAAAFVPVSSDVVVVFGCEGDELDAVSDESLGSAAVLGADAVEAVTPAKRLADELEELEAVRAAAAVDTSDLPGAMRAIASVAADALSCEVAAVYIAHGDRLEVVERGWSLQASHAELAAALGSLVGGDRLPYCVQDAAVLPLPPPIGAEPGIRSFYVVELQGPARGVLFVAHTDAAPRGFTLLCRRLGLRLADVVSAKLGVAITQAWCAEEAVRLHAAFGALDAS